VEKVVRGVTTVMATALVQALVVPWVSVIPAATALLGQTDSRSLRRIAGVTMAENRASKRLPMACEPHKYRIGEGLPTRFFCQAQYTHVSRTL
jgi:hypothetical protein